jgi:hypothetical protein
MRFRHAAGLNRDIRRSMTKRSGDSLPATRVIATMKARIYRPAKTAMQSGTAKTERWLLEYEPAERRAREPLMGWTSSSDMLSQIRLWFDTQAEAEAYARRNGIPYSLEHPKTQNRRAMAYSDNFRFDRIGTWTH